MAKLSPVPAVQPLLEATDGKSATWLMNVRWVQWLVALVTALQTAAFSLGRVDLAAQAASIGATALPTPTLTTATYRLSWYGRITRAATVSSSLIVTLGWTNGGVACTSASVAVTGNTTATTTQGEIIVNADQATSLTYATTYASNGATTMQYALTVIAAVLS